MMIDTIDLTTLYYIMQDRDLIILWREIPCESQAFVLQRTICLVS